MGRHKEYRQRLKYQVASAKKKTLGYQLAVKLNSELGMSETESRLLAHRLSRWVLLRPDIRGPNQIIVEASAGCDHFVRKWREGKRIRLTPYDMEDIDLELEFGLTTMQTGRLLRLIEQAHQQDALLSAKQLSLLTNITPTSLRRRLKEIRKQGIWAPVMGLSKKDRARAGLMRSSWVVQQYFKGHSPQEIRRTAAVSRQRFSDILDRVGDLTQRVSEGTFQPSTREEAEWVELIKTAPKERLAEITAQPLTPRESGEWSDFRKELETDFGLSPVKIRAVRQSLEEITQTLSETRPDGEVIYWAVSAGEPAGKPLERCQLVPVRLTLFDPADMSVSDRDLNRLNQIKFNKVLRYATEAKRDGGYLTYADLGYLLGIHTEAIRRLVQQNPQVVVPLRGLECDIGRGVSHRKKIIELYLQMYTETEIVARTGHSYEAVENYIKEFAAVLVLYEQGLTAPLIRRVTGRSMKLVRAYLDLIREYSGPEYAFRLHHLRKVFSTHEAEIKKNFRGEGL